MAITRLKKYLPDFWIIQVVCTMIYNVYMTIAHCGDESVKYWGYEIQRQNNKEVK